MGDTFSSNICATPSNGTASLLIVNDELCLSYQADENYTGKDSVCIKVCDQSGACDSLLVVITILSNEEIPENKRPTIALVAPLVTQEDSPISTCIEFTDPDIGDSFSTTICNDPTYGNATVNIVDKTLCLDYLPLESYVGMDTLCLAVCDQAGACDEVIIFISVLSGDTPPIMNGPPVINPITTPITTPEDTPITVCTSFTDPDAEDTFTASICTDSINGTALVNIVNAQLCLTYQPSTNFTGLDLVCISVCDQAANCTELEAMITVIQVEDNPENAPPSIESITPVSTPEDTPITVCSSFTDSDVGDTFTTSICNRSMHGTAMLAIVNGQLCVDYEPAIDYNGVDTICITICDQLGACDMEEIIITVTPVNDAPVITPFPIQLIPADSTLSICTAFMDTDIGDNHTALICDASANENAQLTIVNGEICLSYTPNINYEGIDRLCIAVCDGIDCAETEFTIFVTSVDSVSADCAQFFTQLKVASNSPVCAGSNLELYVENPIPDQDYDWFTQKENNFVGSGATLFIDKVDIRDAGNYYVRASTANCTSAISNESGIIAAVFTEVIVENPIKEIAQTEDYLVSCDSTITITSKTPQFVNGYWSTEGEVLEIMEPTNPSTLVTNLQPGENILVWSLQANSCSISTSDTLIVEYSPPPVAYDDAYSLDMNESQDLNLMDNDDILIGEASIYVLTDLEYGQMQRNGSGIYTYIPNENAVGKETFTYQICGKACRDSCAEAIVSIRIGASVDCFGGGLVSANNDGFNDTFIVPCLENYSNSAITIYNRYGDEVYHSLDYKNDWDGTYNGEPLPTGTYFYLLFINDAENTTLSDFLFLQR